MKFKVDSLRLQHSKYGGYFLAIDFNDRVSMGIKISHKKFLEIEKAIETMFPRLVIDD